MDWLNDLIKNNPHIAVGFPAILSCFSFFGNLVQALSDGVIDDAELHQLMSSASGFEMVILLIIMVALRTKKK